MLRLESLESRRVLTTFFVDGAAPDGGTGGSADPFDTIAEAIQAAVDSTGADTISIAPGVYNEHLEIQDAASLTLEGNGATIDAGDDSVSVIEIEDSGHVTIRNLIVQGGDDGINADTLQSLTVENVTATNNDGDGLNLDDIQSVRLNNVWALDNGDEGAQVEDTETVHVVGGNYSGNSGDGLQLEDTRIVVVQGGTYSNNDDGIDIEVNNGQIHSVKLHDVVANGNDDEGVEVDGVDFIQIAGGLFAGNEEAGLDIDDSAIVHIRGVTATGNLENGLQITAGDDGLPDSIVQQVLVIDSVFNDNTGDGINIRSDAATSFVQKVQLNKVEASGNTESGLDIQAVDINLSLVVSGLAAGNGLDDVFA